MGGGSHPTGQVSHDVDRKTRNGGAAPIPRSGLVQRTLCYTNRHMNREVVISESKALAVASRDGILVPRVIAAAGDQAARRFLEFFAATIRNKNTRMAYHHACGVAVQLSLLRHPGFGLRPESGAPATLIQFLARQIGAT